MKKAQRKKYNYNRIMKEVLLNDEVYSWVTLYHELGVMDWFKERDIAPDVKYIFMSQPMVQYISFVLEDKYVVGKYRQRFTDRFIRKTAQTAGHRIFGGRRSAVAVRIIV